MHNKNIKLVYVILVLYGVNGAKRRTESECEKTSRFQVDERSINPHMMVIEHRQTKSSAGLAILISKYFVVTNNNDLYRIKNGTSWYRIRKLKVVSEEYPDSHMFTINSIIPHERNEIALIKLNEAVPYDSNSAIFQPACLWTEHIMPSTNAYSIYEAPYKNYKISNLLIKSVNVISDEDCTKMLEGTNYFSNSYMCVNSSEKLNSENIASVIVTKVTNRNYMVGVVFGFYNINSIILGVKINSLIPWFESLVWAKNPDSLPLRDCGQRKVRHKPLIAHGLPTYNGQFPWHVALFRFEGGLQNSLTYICGGTIINYKTILTVAHCVVDERGVIQPYRLVIMAGTHNLQKYSNSTRTYSVTKITIHEEFDVMYMKNDIALLKLNCRMKFSNYIQPVCISPNLNFDATITTVGTVAGWGKGESDQNSNVLLQATFLIHNNTVCRKSDREFYQIFLNDGNYCAGHQNGTNVCSGDSGGAMIIQNNLRWHIRGIVSIGAALNNSNECNLNHTVLFTDVQKFYKWIVNNL